MKRQQRLALVVALAALLADCASAPPNLTPAAVTAFNQSRLEKTLDVIRDTAQDGSTASPPVVAVADAVTITKWHQSAVLIIETQGAGWPVQVAVSLDQLLTNLPPSTRTLVAPYVALAKLVLQQVVTP